MRNAEEALVAIAGGGWEPQLPALELRSGMLLVRAGQPRVRAGDPESLRAALREAGVAATTYSGGLVRLSMPPDEWQPGELDHLRRAFKLLG